MKSGDVMRQLMKDIWVAAALVRILSTPSIRGASILDTLSRTPPSPVTGQVVHITLLLLKWKS